MVYGREVPREDKAVEATRGNTSLVVVQKISMLSLSISFFSTIIWTGEYATLTTNKSNNKNKEELNLKVMQLFSEKVPSA